MKRKAALRKDLRLKKKNPTPEKNWDELEVYGTVEADPFETATTTPPPTPPAPREKPILALPPSNENDWQQMSRGWKKGLDYGLGGEGGFYTKSIVTNRAPKEEYGDLRLPGRMAFTAGRIAADVPGNGTRHFFWNVHPSDWGYSISQNFIKNAGGNKLASVMVPYAAVEAMGMASGNYNPLNLGGGGRTAGYQAVSPHEDDPRISTAPAYDLLVAQGMLGRKGSLLPWEEFTKERPEVAYEDYAKYKDYLFNKNPGLLNKTTLGLVKGTLDGIEGPEVQILGYRVTPMGALAGLGTLGAGLLATNRLAKLRVPK